MKKTERTTFTASRFAALCGIDRAALTRRLSEQNAKPVATDGRGDEFAMRDLYNAACGGNQAAERLRKLRAEADRLEHDLSVKRREFIRVEDVKKLGEKVVRASTNVVLRSDLPHEVQDKFLNEMAALAKLDWGKEAGE